MSQASNLEERRLARACAWCHGPIPADARSDAKTCSQPCRRAKARFVVSPANATATVPRSLGYADPPYIGRARRCYGVAEVDHRALVRGLDATFETWALSCAADSLQLVLSFCPTEALRVHPWIRGERRGRSYGARSSWEALIVCRARPRLVLPQESMPDSLVASSRPQRSHPDALIGMKPAAFSRWLFDMMGAAAGDTFCDLFAGSGAVARAWLMFSGDASSLQQHDVSRLLVTTRRASTRDGCEDVSLRSRRDASRSAPATDWTDDARRSARVQLQLTAPPVGAARSDGT